MTMYEHQHHSPFTVVVADTGSRVRFDHLDDANRYMSVQLNIYNRTSSVFDRHGQCVGANETFIPGGPILGDDAA